MTAETFVSSPYHSALLPHFGQILAHDLSLQVEQTVVNCTIHPDDSDNCYNIKVQEDKVMPHRRSIACLGRALEREQLNMVTSFVDASQVYGSTDLRMRELREFRGGRLR